MRSRAVGCAAIAIVGLALAGALASFAGTRTDAASSAPAATGTGESTAASYKTIRFVGVVSSADAASAKTLRADLAAEA